MPPRGLGMTPRWSKTAPGEVQEAPRRLQERPRSPQDGLQERSKRRSKVAIVNDKERAYPL
eukprot:9465628-Pyramimonas_sp.AAC.1